MSKLRWTLVALVAVLTVVSTTLASAQTCDAAIDNQCALKSSPDSNDDPSSEASPPDGSSAADEKPQESIESLRDRMFVLVNSERAKANLPALVVQPWAESIAGEHSMRMAAGRSIWHNDYYFAQGRKAMGANFLGENVAMAVSVEGAHRPLMDSPAHRQNILDTRFGHVGIGIARGEDGMIYVTQAFARIPVSASVQPQPSRSTSGSQSESPAVSAPATAGAAATITARIEATESLSVADETSPAEPADALVLSARSSHKGLNVIAAGVWLFVAACMVIWRSRLYLRELASLSARAGALISALSNE